MDLPTADASQPKAIRMTGSSVLENKSGPGFYDPSSFSILDSLLLGGVIVGLIWYLIWGRKKREECDSTAPKSYSIQPTSFVAMPPSENSFIKKLKSSGRSLVVFYGSQTGTAEEFASRLAKEGIRYKMKGMVADPEECDMEELIHLKTIPSSLAVFCMATYGEGDPTDNAMEFIDWLKNGANDLTGLNYAVFGLGNKTYEHYNEVAIQVDHKLEQLGATRVFELGLGDDDANIEDDFITWKDKFWPAVCEFFGIEGAGEDVAIRQYKLTEHVDLPADRIYTGEIARLHSFQVQRPPFDAKNPFLAPIIKNCELHGPASERSCMHIEFDIEKSKIRYETGDHMAVYPVNCAELVEKIGKQCGADLDTVITLTNTDEESTKKHPFPCPCSYRTALTHYLDITSMPRTYVIKELAEYAEDPAEKERLKLIASTTVEGKAAYQQWVVQENRNIVHILEDIPSLKPPLDHLCEILPRLQCRYYSISSSPKLYPTSIHITAVLVEYKTPTGRINKGVTTSWLKKQGLQAQPPSFVPIFVRKSQFRLPMQLTTPIIMVGPGTGLAPFRGFIQERDLARKESKEVGDTILYFGCRKRTEDYLYREELEQYVKNGTLTLHTAFSREQPQKVYVTHLLEQNKEEIWRVIGEQNGHIYICGLVLLLKFLPSFYHACEPQKCSDLAISRQKQKEISDWLQYRASNRQPAMLILSGFSGCGKTTSVKLLAQENRFDVIEWITPIDLAEDENKRIIRHRDRFEDHLIRSTRYRAVLGNGFKQLLLVKDLPNVYQEDHKGFHTLLEKYFQIGKQPVIFVFTETGNSRLLQTLFSPTVREKLGINLININAVTQAAMKNVMKRVSGILNSIASDILHISQRHIDEILSNSIGDVRSAMLNLIFLSLRVPEIYAKSECGLREETLSLLHGVGRVVNPKNANVESHKFVHDPEEIAGFFQSQAVVFVQFLQENYLNTMRTIEEVTVASDVLSLADVFNSEWRDRNLSKVALSYCIRGLMLANEKPVSGWNPVRKPWNNCSDTRRCLTTAETRWYESIIKPVIEKTNEASDNDIKVFIEDD